MNPDNLTRRSSNRRRPKTYLAGLERLEGRALLSVAEFELSSLLAANGGDGSNGSVMTGAIERGFLGGQLSHYEQVGDVDQDGIDDLLVGATGFVSGGQTGRVFLVFGRPGGLPSELGLDSLDGSTGYIFDGLQAGDRLGWSGGGVGDLNSDGIPDFALVADGQSPSGEDLSGDRTFVIHGGRAHLEALDLGDGAADGRIGLPAIDGTHGFVINGVPTPGTVGSLINGTKIRGVGDVNGDLVDDLAITGSLPSGGATTGQVFVVFGRGPGSTAGASFPPSFELASLNGSNGFIMPGLDTHYSAYSLTIAGAGDVNDDGIGDLVLGAPNVSHSGLLYNGRAHVIFGRPSFPATFDLNTLDGSSGFTVQGTISANNNNNYVGYAVDGAGDVNGDGVNDILIGVFGLNFPDSTGGALVIFGKSVATAGPFPAIVQGATLNGSNGLTLVGAIGDRAGLSASGAGDVNGDGVDDILIGAGLADPNGVNDAGRAYLVYGRPSFGATLPLASLLPANGGNGSAGYVLNGFAATGVPRAVGIGDINGDGFNDLAIAAASADVNGLADNGQVYLVYGKPSPAPPATKFYVVNDGGPDRTYEYGPDGAAVENYTLNSGNTAPRGAASTAAGDKVWVVDANKKVYVYDAAGALLGSWTAGSLASNATVEGVATNGTDVWIVDARQDRVYRYAGAATRLSGSQNAASSFALNGSNTGPKDLVTDGTNLWVVNDSSTDKVFKYTLSGSLLGSWTITGAGTSPTGITLDPSGGGHLWVVDNGTDRVYQFDNARSRTSGSQSASASFWLAGGNTNPQGIADPPAGGRILGGKRDLHDAALYDLGRSRPAHSDRVALPPAWPGAEPMTGLATEWYRAKNRLRGSRRG